MSQFFNQLKQIEDAISEVISKTQEALQQELSNFVSRNDLDSAFNSIKDEFLSKTNDRIETTRAEIIQLFTESISQLDTRISKLETDLQELSKEPVIDDPVENPAPVFQLPSEFIQGSVEDLPWSTPFKTGQRVILQAWHHDNNSLEVFGVLYESAPPDGIIYIPSSWLNSLSPGNIQIQALFRDDAGQNILSEDLKLINSGQPADPTPDPADKPNDPVNISLPWSNPLVPDLPEFKETIRVRNGRELVSAQSVKNAHIYCDFDSDNVDVIRPAEGVQIKGRDSGTRITGTNWYFVINLNNSGYNRFQNLILNSSPESYQCQVIGLPNWTIRIPHILIESCSINGGQYGIGGGYDRLQIVNSIIGKDGRTHLHNFYLIQCSNVTISNTEIARASQAGIKFVVENNGAKIGTDLLVTRCEFTGKHAAPIGCGTNASWPDGTKMNDRLRRIAVVDNLFSGQVDHSTYVSIHNVQDLFVVGNKYTNSSKKFLSTSYNSGKIINEDNVLV